jgi:protocatechuate 3,4-dioxygenase beta subunit
VARRRAFVAFVVLAAVATAWLLLGMRGAERADRAGRHRVPVSGPPKLSFPGKAAPGPKDGPQATGPGAPGADAPGSAATALLRVRVVDAAGAPAGGARVEATAPGSAFPFSGAPVATATVARDGLAELVLVPGTYWIRAARGDASSFPAPAAAGGEETVLVIEPARALRLIVVRPEGSPAALFVVQLSLHHADRAPRFAGVTDERGVLELPALPAGWLERMVVEVREPAAVEPAEPAGPVSRLGPSHWEFDLGRDELLAGTVMLHLTVIRLRARVVDEGGTPVPHASLHWAPPGAPDPPSFRFVAVTDEDGRFDVAVQRLAGEAFLIRAPGYAPLVWKPDVQPADRKLQVPEIVLRRGVTLAGRVTDPAGKAVRAHVRLESPRLPGQVAAQDATDDDGCFRFAVADGEHVLYAFRRVDPDLCLPQLRIDGVRGGPDEMRVVLPEPIYGTVRFVAQGTGEAVAVQHLTLIVKDARGAEVAKRTWDPGVPMAQARVEFWEEGTYALEVHTARQEPARVTGVNVVRGRGPDVAVPLVPRR